MKRFLFALLMLSAFAINANAQACTKSSMKSCEGKSASACHAKVASATDNTDYSAAAAQLASTDASIIARTNPVTGEVCYVRKLSETKPNGDAMWVALNYDPATNTFVNVSPSEIQQHQGCGANATPGKSCCAGGAANKSCCAGKEKVASSESSNEAKPVKTAGGSN